MNKFSTFLVSVMVLCGSVCRGEEMILAFTASWCAPCKQFKTDLAENPEMTAGLAIDIIDVGVAKEMAKDFGVNSVPTFVIVNTEGGVVKKDQEVARTAGYQGPRKFQRWVEKR